MSAIEFLISGGMASVGGDLEKKEQDLCNKALKTFGETVRKRGRQLQVPASKLTIFAAPYLLIGRDAKDYFFVFSDKPGGDSINYRNLSQFGRLNLATLTHNVRIEIGEVTWAFSLSISTVQTETAELQNDIDAAAQQYIETTLQLEFEDDPQRVKQEALKFPELAPFVSKFRRDYSEETKTAFVMMIFADTDIHKKILAKVKGVLSPHGITALRADDKEYSDDLFTNIRTYMHCCDFGIAIFDRLLEDDINPNVSLEVGYMMGLNKLVCLLKDQTLKHLQSDLVGKLYKDFDPQHIEDTIGTNLEKWIKDKGFI